MRYLLFLVAICLCTTFAWGQLPEIIQTQPVWEKSKAEVMSEIKQSQAKKSASGRTDHCYPSDTILDYFLRSSGFALTPAAGGGFVAGSNQFTDKIGNVYDFSTTNCVSSFLIWFGAKKMVGSVDTFTASVYEAGTDSLPLGAPLGTMQFTTDDIDSSTTLSFTKLTFNPPVNVSSLANDMFLTVIEHDNVDHDDTLGIVHNSSASGDGQAERRMAQELTPAFGGIWDKSDDIWTGGFDADAMIFPVLKCQIEPEVLADEDVTINAGDSVVIQATVIAGTEGPFTYQWSPSESLSNDTVSDPKAFPDSTTTYTVEVTDTNGCAHSDEVTIVITHQENITQKVGVNVYPNPSDGRFTIELNDAVAQDVHFRVFNSTGQVIRAYEASDVRDGHSHNLDLQDEPAGVYFLHVQTGDATRVYKLMRH